MADNEDANVEELPEPEDQVSFSGPCTCEHEREQHGWGSCNVEGCNCEAGWEE